MSKILKGLQGISRDEELLVTCKRVMQLNNKMNEKFELLITNVGDYKGVTSKYIFGKKL